jgi:hypothetical protein
MPGKQAKHTVDPANVENIPRTQLWHEADTALPTSDDADPAMQLMQLDEPELGWYVPTWHRVQTELPASGAYELDMHTTQSAGETEPD